MKLEHQVQAHPGSGAELAEKGLVEGSVFVPAFARCRPRRLTSHERTREDADVEYTPSGLP